MQAKIFQLTSKELKHKRVVKKIDLNLLFQKLKIPPNIFIFHNTNIIKK